MLDEIASSMVIHRGERSQTLNDVKPVQNISKNLESFLIKCRKKRSPSFT